MSIRYIYMEDDPCLVVEYTDPEEGFQGWLVIDNLSYPLSAGGMRVQPGITMDHLIKMARNMTMKMRLCGLPMDGAKCGIDYNPSSPGKRLAMTRFLQAIKPYIRTCYSMGPDLNTDMEELETIASSLEIPSIKMAIAQAQGFELAYFMERYQVLDQEAMDGWPLGTIRAGYGVAAAALATLDHLGITNSQARVAIQGFGTLAKAAAIGLHQAGVKIVAMSDAEKCLTTKDDELPIQQLLTRQGVLLPDQDELSGSIDQSSSQELLAHSCDLLVLAAIENTVTKENCTAIKARAVVPGANLAVSPEAEVMLLQRNIPVLPCAMAGCGGSLSMNGLFGPDDHPAPGQVLDYIEKKMSAMVHQVLQISQEKKITPSQAALEICDSAKNISRDKPYAV